MMTFDEMTQTGADLYPSNVSQDFKNVVFSWFQFREVADDQKFPIWFKRVIVRDYPQYEQLLRIEPGVSSYDWLVQKYEEAQTYEREENEGSTTKSLSGSTTQTGTITDDGESSKTTSDSISKTGTVADAGTTSNTSRITDTQTGTITDAGSTSKTTSKTSTRDEDNTSSKTVDHAEDNTSSKTVDHVEDNTSSKTVDHAEDNIDTTSQTKSGTTSDDTTTQLSGTDTTTRNLSRGVNDTKTTSKTNVLDSDVVTSGSNSESTKELGRSTPMSASYVGGGFPSTMDWSNPSSQNEAETNGLTSGTTARDDTTTVSGQDIHSGTTTDTGTLATQYGKRDVKERDISTSETIAKSVGTVKDIDISESGRATKDIDISESGRITKDIDISESGRSTKDIDMSENGTESGTSGNTRTLNTSDVKAGTVSGTNDNTRTFNTSDSKSGTESGTKDNVRTLNTAESKSGQESAATTQTNEGLTQHIHTGRDIDISTLLSNAEEFIKGSSAWAWMSGRLEVCFMGVYE